MFLNIIHFQAMKYIQKIGFGDFRVLRQLKRAISPAIPITAIALTVATKGSFSTAAKAPHKADAVQPNPVTLDIN